MHLPIGHIAAVMVHLALLALVFGSLALAVGAATGHATASKAAPAIVAVLAYVVNGLGSVISWLEPVRKFSPFYQYIGHDPLHSGVWVDGLIISAITMAGLVVIAVLGFRRRDVHS